MARVFRLPMFVIAAALLGLIALLATLQYRWLGQISGAERDRMRATLDVRAKAFGEDVDRELTRAYLLFQVDASHDDDETAPEFMARYDRWQATSRFPRLIKDVYLALPDRADDPRPLQRYDASARAMEPASWPPALAPVRAQIVQAQTPKPIPARSSPGTANVVYRAMVPGVWAHVPALVIPSPIVFLNRTDGRPTDVRGLLTSSGIRHTILLLDADYIRREMLPALAQQHFHDARDDVDYRLAVVPTSGPGEAVYRSAAEFAPRADATADALVDLFQVRVQDFGAVASEVNRFATFTAATGRADAGARTQTIIRETVTRTSQPLSIVLQDTTRVGASGQPAHWRLLVQHPSGSLEHAVNAVRRRNIAISTGISGCSA
jgi:hypothetical protein